MKTRLLIIAILFLQTTLFAQSETDTKNFLSDKTTVFRSFGNGKSQSIDFSIKYPSDWKKQEGERPHIVQKFLKTNGSTSISYLVLIKKIDGPKLTQEEISNELNNIETAVPNGGIFISKKTNFKIDGEKAALLTYKMNRKTSVDAEITMYASVYSMIYQNYLIQIQCSVGGTTGSQDFAKIFESYKVFFSLVANSFVLQSKWN